MTQNNSNTSAAPSWVKEELFTEALRETVGEFKEIVNFKAFNALAPGENFASLMLRVQIDLLMPDNSLRTQQFMLKVAHEQRSKFNMFQKETGMYRDIVPELEQLYSKKGMDICFGAKAHTLSDVGDKEYVLMEDLAPKGFGNVNRLECLDWEHTICCLKKLAQWHAASAVRVDQKGAYATLYAEGFLAENCKQLCDQMIKAIQPYALEAVRKLPNHQQYYRKLETLFSDYTNIVFAQRKVDDNEFNVLNHGDYWCNNIMFQYDGKHRVRETYLVDYQMSGYGSPAQDLWYFILSSTQLDFKTERFDEMVHYYHHQLIEHLKVLQYTKPLPSLRDLQKKLLDMDSWIITGVFVIMATVLCKPTPLANTDNFVGNSEDGKELKRLMYFNKRFSKHCEVILPWFFNRRELDC